MRVSSGAWKLPPIVVHDRLTALEAGQTPWHIVDYGLAAAHRVATGRGVRVGIVDTGVDETHAKQKSLAGRVVAAKDFTRSRFGVGDILGHGTHVAGIVAGALSGVAPEADLVVAKALNDQGWGADGDIRAAIEWCADSGCRVINLSLGSDQPAETTLAAIRAAVADDVIVVCAAGNSAGAVNWPAKDPATIAVSAVDRQRKLAPFSCRGPEIWVAAPGHEIQSCWVNGMYSVLSGTSMSAPFLTGMLALRLSWSNVTRGAKVITPANAQDFIAAIAEDVGEPGRDGWYGFGLPVAARLFQVWGPEQPPPDTSVPAPDPKRGVEFDLGIVKVRLPAQTGDFVSVGF